MNKKALGRGLNTLLPPRPHAPDPPPESPAPAAPIELAIDQIKPNPFQPRKRFDEATLNELAQSIQADGIIQPLVVRKAGGSYQLIAGERRWRAARLAGLQAVPVHIHEIADERMLEVALIENIQREDLDPIESALAFQRLSAQLGLNQEEIGRRTGKDRATISNAIRLLQLPRDVQDLVAARQLSPGHARALLKLETSEMIRDMARKAIQNEWSVRQLEALTATRSTPEKPRMDAPAKTPDPNVRAAIDDLERVLGTRVRIVEKARGKGRVEIEYYSQDDLDRIYSAITRDQSA